MKAILLMLNFCFLISISGCSDNSDSSNEVEINPRIPQKPEHKFYGDSVYIISTTIDTVYSFGQWIDLERRNRKHRLDSIQKLHVQQKTEN